MNETRKVVLVTGTSSGIGLATARLFSNNSFQVASVSRHSDSTKRLEQEIPNLKAFRADLRQLDQVERLVEDVVKNLGRLDVLVNAAGILRSGTIENTSLPDWDAMMQINVRSIFWLMQKSLPHLEKTRGNIVNVS